MAQQSGVSPACSTATRNDASKSKHKVFLSHSGEQKAFTERLCVALERCYLHPFFDIRQDSLPIGENFPELIFDAIKECYVGVVILSDKFFTSKWPMMELVAMMDEVGKRKGCFKIIPVFHSISLLEFDDVENRTRWLSKWRDLAMENPKRVEVKKWEDALRYLRPINGLVHDGLSDLRLEKKIVDVICEWIPPEIRMDDTHIQGRDRLCKVIQDKIAMLRENKMDGVCLVGLYGMGGIGKTSICKALCNKSFLEFHRRVCHVELGKSTEEKLMQEMVKKLAGTSHERINELEVDQLRIALKEGIIKEAVFLAIDNVTDSSSSIQQAKNYLSARLPSGSIVMVTARSKDLLMHLRPYVDESKCLEMPELVLEEANLLFTKSADFESGDEDDEQLIERCVKQCYYRKDSDNQSYHYHPLALDVLGRQLGCINPKDWGAQLDKIQKIGEDILNQRKEGTHGVFSILRTSFDTLDSHDQLLFMDVALLIPEGTHGSGDESWWLGMVHGSPTDVIMSALERLKSKSLLESLGDGKKTRIGMHDLWRAFAMAESTTRELASRRWVYEAKTCNELVDTSPSGTCWENVKRMAFLDCELENLERVNFAHFLNIGVLKITGLDVTRRVVVDLSKLIHLKSLELSGKYLHRIVLQGLPRGLIFLSLDSSEDLESRQSILQNPQNVKSSIAGMKEHWVLRTNLRRLTKQIGCLTKLQALILAGLGGSKLPDMTVMVSVREAVFWGCKNVERPTGLSSQLANLRALTFIMCPKLRSCPGMGDLVGLEELCIESCCRLKRLPDLRKLRNLRRLFISLCPLLSEVPGLGDLVALEKLHVGRSDYFKLPDMRKLINLRELRLLECHLEAVPGFENLISLQKVEADFRSVVDKPSLRHLTKLETLDIQGLSLEELAELDNLVMLCYLQIKTCTGVDGLPGFRNLTSLRTLRIRECEFKNLSGLSNMSTLEGLQIYGCKKLERLPDLQRLTRLDLLTIWNCDVLRDWNCTLSQGEGSSCRSNDSSVGMALPDSQRVTNLRTLRLLRCNNLADVTSIGAFSKLVSLDCNNLAVKELPDLSNFPQLETLRLSHCESLRSLTSQKPICALRELELIGCCSLITIPDLSIFPGLLEIRFIECGGITTLSSAGPLTALQQLKIDGCSAVSALPDLGMFPALKGLSLRRCSSVTTLSSSITLPALKSLDVRGCSSLSLAHLDELQALSSQTFECTIHDSFQGAPSGFQMHLSVAYAETRRR